MKNSFIDSLVRKAIRKVTGFEYFYASVTIDLSVANAPGTFNKIPIAVPGSPSKNLLRYDHHQKKWMVYYPHSIEQVSFMKKKPQGKYRQLNFQWTDLDPKFTPQLDEQRKKGNSFKESLLLSHADMVPQRQELVAA